MKSVRGGAISLPQMDELVLGAQFLFLHVVQGGVVQRQHSQFRIADLAVEFLVPLVKAAEFRIALYQHFDVFLLVLEHQPTSSLSLGRGRAVRRTWHAGGHGFAKIRGVTITLNKTTLNKTGMTWAS